MSMNSLAQLFAQLYGHWDTNPFAGFMERQQQPEEQGGHNLNDVISSEYMSNPLKDRLDALWSAQNKPKPPTAGASQLQQAPSFNAATVDGVDGSGRLPPPNYGALKLR